MTFRRVVGDISNQFKQTVHEQFGPMWRKAVESPLGKRVAGPLRTYTDTSIHKSGMRFMKEGMGIGVKSGWKWLGRGFVGISAVTGFIDEGAWGAVKGVAEYAAFDYALGAGGKILGIAGGSIGAVGTGLAVGAAAIGGAAAYNVATGGVLSRPYVREHMRKHAKLEMGRPVHDPFGTTATMRQRSLMAMQRSRINGRSAMGSEATLTYQPYFR